MLLFHNDDDVSPFDELAGKGILGVIVGACRRYLKVGPR